MVAANDNSVVVWKNAIEKIEADELIGAMRSSMRGSNVMPEIL